GGFVLASFLAQTKVFVSIHSGEPSTFKKFKNNKLLYYALFYHLKIHKFLTLKFADKIIGHSKSNLNLNFIDWKSNPKFELVYNGVDFEELNNDLEESNNLNDFIKKEDVVILHIGSFREPKNHLFLIDCFNALNPQKNNYKLILVGSGGLLNTVKE